MDLEPKVRFAGSHDAAQIKLACVNVGVKFIHVWLHERRLFQLHVIVQIFEANPVVQGDGGTYKEQGEVPESELMIAAFPISMTLSHAEMIQIYGQGHGVRQH